MRSIAICGSKRFKKEIEEWATHLREQGITVFVPFLNSKEFVGVDLDPDFVKYIFNGLTRHHFDAIRKADVALFFNKGGYMGISTTLELGVATALGKTVIALETDSEDASRNILFDFFAHSKEELAEYLRGNFAFYPGHL